MIVKNRKSIKLLQRVYSELNTYPKVTYEIGVFYTMQKYDSKAR